MMNLNAIKPASGSTRPSKRLGRGSGSGTGKTAGRGHKGAGSRVGQKHKPYFEGGQTSLIRRIPKRGFNNIFKKIYQVVNVGDLNKINASGREIEVGLLFDQGLVNSKSLPIKILGKGELTTGCTIKANAFSKSAREKIEKAKGKAEVIARAGN